MKRVGILLMLVAFAATGCTRRAGTTGVVVGLGMIVGGTVATRLDEDDDQVPSGPELVGSYTIITGVIIATLSGIVVAALPAASEPQPTPTGETCDEAIARQRIGRWIGHRGTD